MGGHEGNNMYTRWNITQAGKAGVRPSHRPLVCREPQLPPARRRILIPIQPSVWVRVSVRRHRGAHPGVNTGEKEITPFVFIHMQLF